MAITQNFGGATIIRPGSYSRTTIDQGGGFPLSPTGLVGIIGESTRGIPGNEELDIGLNFFTPDQVTQIIDKYGTGSIVDAVNFLFAPAVDGAIPGGAQAIWIYKTNASIKAALDLTRSVAGDYGRIRSQLAGEEGNRITYKNILISEVAPVVTGATYVANAADAGFTFAAYVNGVKATVTVAAGTYATAADVAAAITLAGVTATADAGKVVLTVNADALAATRGYGKSIILEETVVGDLAKIGMVEGMTLSTVESAATLTINHKKFLLVESDTIGGNVVLKAAYTGANATATVQITDTKVILTAGTPIEFTLSAYTTIKDLIEDLNLTADWSFELADALYGQLSPYILDTVTVGAKSDSSTNKPARIKKDYAEFTDFMFGSGIVEFVEATNQLKYGLPPVQTETKLVTVVGALGATTGAEIVEALSAFEAFRLNSVIPLFSRDAIDDIADGLTDSGSTYTIAGVHQALKSHLSKMATIKQRSERQGYPSLKDSFNTCLVTAQDMAYSRMQLCIQDTKNIDAQGSIRWFQPWAEACLLAGGRAGSPVGTPMTNKFANCSGIRQTAQPMRTNEIDIVNDFDPRLQYETAIKNGITFLENPQTGGFKWVVDNTTYGKDGNWVYNRANVQYAADVLAFDFRAQTEAIYVGSKNTIRASEVKSTCESILATYLAQGITVSTDDAKNGYKGLTVRIEGNTIYISFVAKLVEGIDFILTDITIQRATQSA